MAVMVHEHPQGDDSIYEIRHPGGLSGQESRK